ncbi:hypothetical protein [Selenomonas sputigena]|nr:hypothetical protein [Selenomonas sputigena]UZD42772.1 hypothetical protein OL240_09515 [Selenomonas sputigena]
MTEMQAAHVWRTLLELSGVKDFEIEIRKASETEPESESEETKEVVA